MTLSSTYEPCGCECDESACSIERKCPTCQKTVHYMRNATDEPEVVLPGPELRRIERRKRKR